jgi:hypothetical protein
MTTMDEKRAGPRGQPPRKQRYLVMPQTHQRFGQRRQASLMVVELPTPFFLVLDGAAVWWMRNTEESTVSLHNPAKTNPASDCQTRDQQRKIEQVQGACTLGNIAIEKLS